MRPENGFPRGIELQPTLVHEVCELLGIERPIVQAPMGSAADARLAATETDAEWHPDLYEVGWPGAPHRAIRNSTAEAWEMSGRPPPGARPGEGEAVARLASGEPLVRYSSAMALEGTTGDVEALSLWAGQSVALAKRIEPAAAIIAELTSRL